MCNYGYVEYRRGVYLRFSQNLACELNFMSRYDADYLMPLILRQRWAVRKYVRQIANPQIYGPSANMAISGFAICGPNFVAIFGFAICRPNYFAD
jgi:hypothetical protein